VLAAGYTDRLNALFSPQGMARGTVTETNNRVPSRDLPFSSLA
jgi:hypothetical protein